MEKRQLSSAPAISSKQRLDEAGIGIPYPQRDVHVYQVEAKAEA